MSVKNANRVQTGISGLDELIGGGFPKNSLIVLSGKPGTGKTMFSAGFLYNGIVNHGEKGIYASFAENKEAFFSNMLSLGLDFEKLEKAGSFHFLDMVTVREGATPTVVETIFREVYKLEAKRLVIDSFSALVQAFKDPSEVRIVLHTVISRITRLLGCTTLLIVETPYGENKIGLGIEEFVADGIIMLRRTRLDGRILRELELLKMRGTPTPETEAVFTLKGGFKVFPPFKPKKVEKTQRFQPQPDMEEYFSTGSQSLDEVLGGGYPKGSSVLIEIDKHVSTLQYHLIATPTAWNFIAQGRGIIAIPSAGVDLSLILRRCEEVGLTGDEINKLLKVCVKEHPDLKPEPYVVAFKGENILEDYAKYLEVERELMKKTGQPILKINGPDTLIDLYGLKNTLSTLRIDSTRIRETRSLGIVLLKPGYPRLAKILAAIADIHLKITREHGSILVYGVKPRTNIYALEMDVSKGYATPKLTQII